MQPENTNPAAKTETSEFEFDAPQLGNSRIRKRNLKGKPAAQTDANPPAASRPAPAAGPQRPAVYAQPAAATHSAPGTAQPAYVRPSGTDERPQPAPASGVLYYSSPNGSKDAAKAHSPSPVRSTSATPAAVHQRTSAAPSFYRAPVASQPVSQRPAAASTPPSARPVGSTNTPVSNPHPSTGSSTPATSSAASSASRPAGGTTSSTGSAAAGSARAVSTTVAAPSSSSRPASVSDYRSNIERQSREQKSVGNVLNILVYALIAFFVCGGLLAAYGAHDVYKQLRAQSTTVTELDTRYSAENQQLTENLKATQQGVQQLQTQLARAQELILRQQDALTRLQATLDAEAEALRQERATRAAETSIREQETSALRSRLRALEARNEAAYRP
jgi:cell division protein FtsB